MSWCVYIIESDDGTLYTGVTTHIARRFAQHLNRGRGARYFNGRRPVGVVFLEHGHDRSSALRREAAIKRLNRAEKLALKQTLISLENYG